MCCCRVLTACLDQGRCRLSPADSPGGRRLPEAGACLRSLPAAPCAELCRRSALGLCHFGLLPTRGFISALQKQKDRKKQEKLKQELKSKQEAESVSGPAPFSPPSSLLPCSSWAVVLGSPAACVRRLRGLPQTSGRAELGLRELPGAQPCLQLPSCSRSLSAERLVSERRCSRRGWWCRGGEGLLSPQPLSEPRG